MKTLIGLFIVALLSGCAALKPPNRWIEDNTIVSTKSPSIEIKVTPSLHYDKDKISDRVTKSDDAKYTAGMATDQFYFVDKDQKRRINVKIENLAYTKKMYFVLPDYAANPSSLYSKDETIGGIRFKTAILRNKYEKSPVMCKVFGALVGEDARYQIYYMENVTQDWLDKYLSQLTRDDQDFITAFHKRANESFSIASYSGRLPPSQKAEQKTDSLTKSSVPAGGNVKPANNIATALPDNIKEEIRAKCASDSPTDYIQQADCVKKQEAAWIELRL